ncbi:unnamed protein product [Rotaria socialis]|nr:unnamed protein product [Rotaria socialis]CAF3666583.1 unnamed protein product [Rotaria socialis]CAF3745610.1 unnamed protein product [Rotaria socialis]CAF4425983.1 unnamed protein product [Rotaria socialis]CAF4460737.1 unnamed protein product [Rotaria socialis]
MQLSQILSLFGAGIGVVTVVLGIVALATPSWIILAAPPAINSTYSLFQRCNESSVPQLAGIVGCAKLNGFQTPQGLTISGVIIVVLGIASSILLGMLDTNRYIKYVPHFLLVTGPTLILIGVLFYVKNVLANFTAGSTKLDLGYSFILIVITCIIGYISSAYFGFVTGLAEGYYRAGLTSHSHN